ncbi:MAG: T9SS type A sorting domain-containing protein [Chitinophagaceae bacterium]
MKQFYAQPLNYIVNAVLVLITVCIGLPTMAQCPVGSTTNGTGNITNGQVTCITTTVSASININNGGQMLIVSGGKYTGNITANQGSSITVNSGGELSPSSFNTFGVALTNNGVTKLPSLNIGNGASVTNSGTFTWSSFNMNSAITITNTACGYMDFASSVSFNRSGSSIINGGKLNFLSDITTSSGTTINNRGLIYVKGKLDNTGKLYNQYRMVMLGDASLKNGDSVVNLYQMIFKNGFNIEAKIRNEGLFWVGGSVTFNSSAAFKMNNSNAQFRIAGALMNNIAITSAGMLYVAGSVNNNSTIQGISSSQKIQINQNMSNATNNVQVNTSMMAYDSSNYISSYANPDVCSTTLPLELSALQASYKNKAVQLSWYTVSESNTQNFYVEFSTNGVDFTTAGTVKAAGNSNSKINYSYTHTTTANGTLYYRLREVDVDGKTNFSNIAAVKATASADITSSIYPNPFTERINFSITLQTSVPVSVTLYDANGRMIQKVIRQGQSGTNQVSLTGLSSLTPGIYMASITAGEFTTVQKLVK